MITLERVGSLTGTAQPNLCASLSQVKQHPSSLAGEHTSLPPSDAIISPLSQAFGHKHTALTVFAGA